MFKMYDSIEKYQIITSGYLMSGVKSCYFYRKNLSIFCKKKAGQGG